jgi:hypothetical protein
VAALLHQVKREGGREGGGERRKEGWAVPLELRLVPLFHPMREGGREGGRGGEGREEGEKRN